MKKRIALAVAFATAISIGNMVPAFAAKLTAPGTVVDGCSRAGGTLVVNDDADNALNVYINTASNTTLYLLGDDGACDTTEAALLDLTEVQINANSVVTFYLEKQVADDTVALWSGITFKVRTSAGLVFSSASLTASRFISGTITEEAFTFGSLTGTYYAPAITYTGHQGTDTVDGSAVTTTPLTMTGGAGDDTLKGGALGDTLTAGAGKDKLYGNAGDDTLNATDDTDGSDQLWGGAGNDTLNAETDAPTGGAACTTDCSEDVVAPGDGYDLVSGYAAALTYVDSTVGVTLNLTTAGGAVASSAGNDVYSAGNIDSFTGSEFADTMIGGSGDDVFNGGSGADTLSGLGGDDDLSGAGGADVITGGEDADHLSGNSGADKINGGLGDDTVSGGGGDDVLRGSAGDDVLRGGSGSDQAWGGQGHFDICAAEVTDHCEFKNK